MTREWQPGDVAEYHGVIPGRMMLTADGWIDADGESRDPALSLLRPVVVIDPEDREQVERLAKRLRFSGYEPDADTIAATLRSLIAPPRPEEPQGLGAVVEDAEGYWWVSAFCDGKREWYRDNVVGGWRKWSDIDAVKVLSDGVER